MMGPFFIVFSILPMAILLLAAVWCIRSLWITLMPPRGWKMAAKVRGIGAEPVCEKCRYPVLGLTTFQCPECGTDLRRTGIITRSMEMRRRGGLGAALISLTLVIGVGAAIGLTYLTYRLSPSSFGGATNTCTLSPGPSNGAGLSINIMFMDWNQTPAVATLMMNGSSGKWTNYSVDPVAKTIIDAGVSTVTPAGGGTIVTGGGTYTLDQSGIETALSKGGLDTTTDLGKKQAAQILALLNTVGGPRESLFSTPTDAFLSASVQLAPEGVSRGTYLLWMLLAGGFFVAVWAGMIVLVVRRRRRVLREVDAREAVATAGMPPSPASPPPAASPPVSTM